MIFINAHEIVLNEQEKLEAWTSYDQVAQLAMDFIKNCPRDESNGLPWYMQYSCFWTDPVRPTIWPDNPAGKFAWATTTLLKYYPYSGDASHIAIVSEMLERLWEYRSSDDGAWPGVPYASAEPGTGEYYGARADGKYVTEADKVAQAGKAFLDFYKMSGEKKYYMMGTHCAEVLSEKLSEGDETHSPLPFRVDVRDGSIIEEYSAHMIAAVRLFDEMVRLGNDQYQNERDVVWDWIEQYPLQNMLWKGHFEDIRIDQENLNRDQLSALETARYILENHQIFPEWKKDVGRILSWVIETFGAPSFFYAIPIHEQKFCYFVMGSHTARFASICAMFWELTGMQEYKEHAIRAFNWASYMANEDGTVTVGVDRPDYYNQCWFTDGYFDYVPHFLDGMAAMPEKAPENEDHLLRSSAIVQEIHFATKHIRYKTFEEDGQQRLRLSFEPKFVLADNKPLSQKETPDDSPGWCFHKEVSNVIDIFPGAREVEVRG